MKFKGTNSTTSITELVAERIKYKLNPQNDTNIVDYNFTDRVYYGRIDKNYNSIYPKEESLKGLDNSYDVSSAPVVMNFVSDAFTAFTRKIDQAKLMGKVTEDSFMFNLKVHKAYENPQQVYVTFVNEYINEFNKTIDRDKIQKFEDWVHELLKWNSNNGSNFPMTFSGFQKSKRSNIFTSGLAISLSSDSIGDDSTKEKYLNDKQYGFYLNAAKQYGFNIHQNAPWILIADLNSPALLLYLEKYNLSSESLIFSENFLLCFERDLQLLINILNYNWRLFIDNNEKLTIIDTTCNNTKINNIYINNNINNNIIYNIINYINIRNTEEYSRYSKPELDRIKEKAIIFQKKLDISKSIGYINEQFRILSTKRSGTLNHRVNINRRNNDISDN